MSSLLLLLGDNAISHDCEQMTGSVLVLRVIANILLYEDHSNSTGIANLDLRTIVASLLSDFSAQPNAWHRTGGNICQMNKEQQLLMLHMRSTSHLPGISESLKTYQLISLITLGSTAAAVSPFQGGFLQSQLNSSAIFGLNQSQLP